MTEKEFRWVHVNSKDELEAFYRGVLPNIITEARAHGYAIGVHGSLRRDLDLIAVPWTGDHSDKDELAHAIQEAALGPAQSSYQWERKPNGRMAVSFPICWAEISPTFKNETNLAHIDLSVMAVTPLPEVVAKEYVEECEATIRHLSLLLHDVRYDRNGWRERVLDFSNNGVNASAVSPLATITKEKP